MKIGLEYLSYHGNPTQQATDSGEVIFWSETWKCLGKKTVEDPKRELKDVSSADNREKGTHIILLKEISWSSYYRYGWNLAPPGMYETL